MIRILKNSKGMSLIELIVGLFLFALASAAVSATLVPVLTAYAAASEFAESSALVDNLANQVVSDLSGMTAPLGDDSLGRENMLSITVDSPDDVRYTADTSTGVLLRNGIAVLPKPYYKNKSVRFICNPVTAGSDMYRLTVTILSDTDGRTMITRDYTVRPIALELNQYGLQLLAKPAMGKPAVAAI